MTRAAAGSIVGGTVAAATGGNFWDGFETGAASRLFNDEAHKLEAEHTYANDKELAKDMRPNSVVIGERALENSGGTKIVSNLTHSLDVDIAHEAGFYTNAEGRLFSFGYSKRGIEVGRNELKNVSEFKFGEIYHGVSVVLAQTLSDSSRFFGSGCQVKSELVQIIQRIKNRQLITRWFSAIVAVCSVLIAGLELFNHFKN